MVEEDEMMSMRNCKQRVEIGQEVQILEEKGRGSKLLGENRKERRKEKEKLRRGWGIRKKGEHKKGRRRGGEGK